MSKAGSFAVPRFALILAAGAVLGGCQMTTLNGGQDATALAETSASASSSGSRVIERDVEAPDVFQRNEAGLWDGRPSLGGVWVAHPTARDPERVLIRNGTTGAEVIGALFRRERENPGPRFQISSEAANALGILPGAPTEISVTALRLQRVELEIEPEPTTATAADETLAIADAPASEAAAPVAAAAAVTPDAAPEGTVEIVEETPRRRALGDLFRRRPAEPEAAIAETALAPIEAAPEVAAAPMAMAAAEATETVATAEAPRSGGLFGLFRRRPQPEPDTTLIALPDVTDTAAAPMQAPMQPAAQAQPAQRIARPYVQIGIFSVEQNATNARNRMQASGLSAEIRRGRVGNNLFWRVVVGPATSNQEHAEILRRVRGLGFADAYGVAR